MFKSYPFIGLFLFSLTTSVQSSEIDPSAPISIRRICNKPGNYFCYDCVKALRMENNACQCNVRLMKGWYDFSCNFHHTQYLSWLEEGSEESYMLSTMTVPTKKPATKKPVNLRAKHRAQQ